MGETKKGEGRDREVSTSDLTRYIVQYHKDEDVILDRLVINFVTEGLYSVSVTERGSNQEESYFVSIK